MQILKRVLTLLLAVSLFFAMAKSCTAPWDRSSTASGQTLGILKRDPSIRADGFGSVADIEGVNCQVEACLRALSGIKVVQIDSEKIFFLTRDKGLFLTENSGRSWKRIYIFPVEPEKTKKVLQKNSSGVEEEKEIARPDSEIQTERNQKIQKNDSFVAWDFLVWGEKNEQILISGQEKNSSGKMLAKLYASWDGGVSFQEIYAEVDEGVSVRYIWKNSAKPQEIYAVLTKNGSSSIIYSSNSGLDWQKIRSDKEIPIQIGLLESKETVKHQTILWFLYENRLDMSLDFGKTFSQISLSRFGSLIGEENKKDGLNIPILSNNKAFGKLEKIIVVPKTELTFEQRNTIERLEEQNKNSQNSQNQLNIPFLNNSTQNTQNSQNTNSKNPNSTQKSSQSSSSLSETETLKLAEEKQKQETLAKILQNYSWMLVADRQIWLTENIEQPMRKLVFPLQADQYNILDAVGDRNLGLDKILVSVDNKLFESRNRGQSWTVKDKISFATTIGNIGQIVVDPGNSEIIYLMLVDPRYKRQNGFR